MLHNKLKYQLQILYCTFLSPFNIPFEILFILKTSLGLMSLIKVIALFVNIIS